MRKKIVAGNWKMNTTVSEGVELAKAVVARSAEVPANVGLIVAAPMPSRVPRWKYPRRTAPTMRRVLTPERSP